VSLLDNLPHRCTIRRRTRAKGSLGGSKDSYTIEQTSVECWQQPAGDSEIAEFQKDGVSISHKVYFVANPSVTSRHQLLITYWDGAVVSTPVPLDVVSHSVPDASAGMGVVWRVFCNEVR